MAKTQASISDERHIKKLVSQNMNVMMYCGTGAFGIKMWDIHHIVFKFSQKYNLDYDVSNKLFNLFTKERAKTQYVKICKDIISNQGQETLDLIMTKALNKYVYKKSWKTCDVSDMEIDEIDCRIILMIKYEEFNQISHTMEYEDREYIKEIIDFRYLDDINSIPEKTYESIAMHIKKSVSLVKEWIKGYHKYDKERREDIEIEAKLLI